MCSVETIRRENRRVYECDLCELQEGPDLCLRGCDGFVLGMRTKVVCVGFAVYQSLDREKVLLLVTAVVRITRTYVSVRSGCICLDVSQASDDNKSYILSASYGSGQRFQV